MNLTNLLLASKSFIEVSVEGIGTIELGKLGYVISWIFDLVSDIPGAIAVGVILFTLALKTLVLPLDIYSRVKMRKQSLLMESMRPEMEKLQKQYASDQQMYSQKLMELQRSHGYNPLGACLPTLISLIIFIVIFQSFSQYSQYANLSSYNDMTKAYSSTVNQYVILTNDEQSQDGAEGQDKYFLTAAIKDGESSYTTEVKPHHVNDDGILVDEQGKELKVYGYFVNYDKFANYYVEQGNALPDNWDNMVAEIEADGENSLNYQNEINEVVENFVRVGARAAAAKYYNDHKSATSLIWIGNIWYPDSMLNKEVPDYSSFISSVNRVVGSTVDANYEVSYNEVTFNLEKQKNTYNGYFVLIVLAIGFMFLQQFITMRSQKAASEFSSVDGQGARTNKMMMIIMPIIFGFFSFFYSAAFSIYMIINTMYSFISTLIINKIVSVRFDKDAEDNARKKLQGRAGRKRLK